MKIQNKQYMLKQQKCDFTADRYHSMTGIYDWDLGTWITRGRTEEGLYMSVYECVRDSDSDRESMCVRIYNIYECACSSSPKPARPASKRLETSSRRGVWSPVLATAAIPSLALALPVWNLQPARLLQEERRTRTRTRRSGRNRK